MNEQYGMTLPHVIAQCVHFAWNDYANDGPLPEDVVWTVSYQVACYLAQHTPEGEHGVDTETGLRSLKVDEDMPYAERLALAEQVVADHGGAKP